MRPTQREMELKVKWPAATQTDLALHQKVSLTAVPIGHASLPSSHQEDLYFQIITRPETMELGC